MKKRPELPQVWQVRIGPFKNEDEAAKVTLGLDVLTHGRYLLVLERLL